MNPEVYYNPMYSDFKHLSNTLSNQPELFNKLPSNIKSLYKLLGDLVDGNEVMEQEIEHIFFSRSLNRICEHLNK